MPSLARLRDVDSQYWSTATWATPFITQVVLAVGIVAAWLVGKRLHNGLVVFLISTAITALIAAATAALLLRSASPRARGVALSILGTSAIVFVGGLVYGVWILRW